MIRASTIAVLCLTVVAGTRAEVYQMSLPSDDRWHYPFNFSPGIRGAASCFGSTGDPNFTTFNDRDGIFLIAWRSDAIIPAGLPPKSYGLDAVRVTLTHLGGAPGAPISWPIDLTPDEWFTLDYPVTDVDPGQPLELFGVGFGPGYTAANWNESSPYTGSDDQQFVRRDPYPFVFQSGTNTKVHIEDNVKDGFTPIPWAIGVPVGYTPQLQIAPFPVHFDIDLGLSGGQVRSHFQEQLAAGKVFVAVTSLQVTFMFAETGFPTFFTKEGAPLVVGGRAPLLEITLTSTGDANGNGNRDVADVGSLEKCMDGPDLLPLAPSPLSTDRCLFLFDFDEDGDVDIMDFGAFARRFP